VAFKPNSGLTEVVGREDHGHDTLARVELLRFPTEQVSLHLLPTPRHAVEVGAGGNDPHPSSGTSAHLPKNVSKSSGDVSVQPSRLVTL
jgi:hypothetical protein